MNFAVEEHHITVPRTARYHTLGDPQTAQAIWIVLHGYAQLARYFLRAFEGLDRDLLIVAPEGLSRFYVDAEHVRVGATWMTREDREHEMADQYSYLDALAARCRDLTSKDIPVKVLGFSQGVATASRWCTHGSTDIKELVLWGGELPLELQPEQLSARWHRTSVTLVHGEQDALVPETVLAVSEARLRAAGVPHAIQRFPGGHALDKLLLQRILIK